MASTERRSACPTRPRTGKPSVGSAATARATVARIRLYDCGGDGVAIAFVGGGALHGLPHRNLALLVLPPRRRERRAPRFVKIKMSGYKESSDGLIVIRNDAKVDSVGVQSRIQ